MRIISDLSLSLSRMEPFYPIFKLPRITHRIILEKGRENIRFSFLSFFAFEFASSEEGDLTKSKVNLFTIRRKGRRAREERGRESQRWPIYHALNSIWLSESLLNHFTKSNERQNCKLQLIFWSSFFCKSPKFILCYTQTHSISSCFTCPFIFLSNLSLSLSLSLLLSSCLQSWWTFFYKILPHLPGSQSLKWNLASRGPKSRNCQLLCVCYQGERKREREREREMRMRV